MRVLIVGAGGHGQVVAECLLLQFQLGGSLEPVGYLDDDPALHGERRLGLPILGGLAQLGSVAHEALVIGIGHNRTRRDIFVRLRQQGEQFVNAIHPRAVMSQFSELGVGSVICAGAIANTGAVIGDNVIMNTGCTVDHDNRIAAHCHLAPGAHLAGDVRVAEGALVGMGAAILPGRRVGAWSTVGAGAVVTEDVPDGATVVGVPARPILRKR